MAKIKKVHKTTKKTSVKHVKENESIEFSPSEDVVDSQSDINQPSKEIKTGSKDKLTNIIGMVVIALVFLGVFAFKKGWLVAAMVDGKPIFTYQLTGSLVSRFGQQALESMITESLIVGEADKNGITITQADIDTRENEMVKSFGGNMKIEDVLKFQGMTKADFDAQIKLQLLVEKILGKDIKLSDSELDQYISTNSARLVSTSSAEIKEEAKKLFVEEQINKKIQPWFLDLKNKAKISKFL
jgi:hypothetical protein